jgi:hypothetical protein
MLTGRQQENYSERYRTVEAAWKKRQILFGTSQPLMWEAGRVTGR